jgi:hypothetical protein
MLQRNSQRWQLIQGCVLLLLHNNRACHTQHTALHSRAITCVITPAHLQPWLEDGVYQLVCHCCVIRVRLAQDVLDRPRRCHAAKEGTPQRRLPAAKPLSMLESRLR